MVIFNEPKRGEMGAALSTKESTSVAPTVEAPSDVAPTVETPSVAPTVEAPSVAPEVEAPSAAPAVERQELDLASKPSQQPDAARIFTGKPTKGKRPMPSTYQRSRWEKKYGSLFEDVLKGDENAPIRLVDAHWLVSRVSKGGELHGIAHRQSLPEAAFLSLAEVQMCGIANGVLPIICVSYPWLSPAHPDPQGFHVTTLARALHALTVEPADVSATLVGPGNTQRYGVFIDFCSLFQHPRPDGGEFRTAGQDAKFKEGLSKLGALYSAPGTIVARLTALPDGYPAGYELPEGCNVAAYDNRGWCFTESRWATLTKPDSASLDIGRLGGGDGASLSRAELIETCARGGSRPPPLLPAQFTEALETKMFTNGKADRPLVGSLYETAFHNTFRHAFVLQYNHLGWDDDDVLQLSAVLDAVVEPAAVGKGKADAGTKGRSSRAAQLNELYLQGNTFGDAAAVTLCSVAARLRGLTWLNMSDNPKLSDDTLTHLATLLDASRSNFKRLREVRLCGTSAGADAIQSLEKACVKRKVQLRLTMGSA